MIKKRSIDTLTILVFTVLILSLTTFINVYQTTKTINLLKIDPENKLTLNFTTLNESEIALAQKIIDDIKPSFIQGQKSITFTKDIESDFFNEVNENITNGCEIAGFNKLMGVIYIRYIEDEGYLRQTVCHELLHTFLTGPNEEDMVYQISNYYDVCYKEPNGERFVIYVQ